MKTLREWLEAHNMKPEAFAGLLNVHWVTVFKWMKGTARPSFAKLSEIERITEGTVTARTLVSTSRIGKKQKREAGSHAEA